MRTLFAVIAAALVSLSLSAQGINPQPRPYTLVSSNATVTFATNAADYILDLTAVVPASTNSGNWQAIGTNSANLAPSGGTATMPFAAIGTNRVGYGVFTNGWGIGNATFLPSMAVSNNVGTIFQAGSFQPFANPTAPTTNVISGAGSLNGTYQYAWTFYGGGGDTLPSPVSTITVTNNSVLVTTPGPGRGENGRRLWRTAAGGAQLKLLYDFGFGDAGRAWHKTQFLDDVADGALGIDAPTSNTSSLEEFTTTKSVKFFATDYSAAQSGDLTLLTQKQDDPNSLALDVYGQTVIRNILGQPLATYKTGNSGNQLALSHQSTLAGSPINAVFLVRPGGSLEMWPDGTDTNVHAIYINNYGIHIANGGGIIVSGASTLDDQVTIGHPITYGDASLTVNMVPNAGLGRHAAIRATAYDTGANALFWGHLNTNYLSSIGFRPGGGDPEINFFCYESTNANNQAYSGTVHAPSQIRAMTGSGNLQFNMAPAGASDADISWTQVMKLLHSGGVVIGTNIFDPGTMNLRVDGGITTGTNVTVGGNFFVSGTSSLTGKVEVASPSLTDATVSIGATNFTGLNAPLRVTGNGNNILIGHGNTDYLSSIGANFGGGSLEIAAYGYQTNSAIAYSGAINRPTVMRFNGNGTGFPGSISFLNAPLGTTGNEATLTQNLYIAPSGGLSIGPSTIDVPASSLVVPGTGYIATSEATSMLANSILATNQITTPYLLVTTSGADITGRVRTDEIEVTNSFNLHSASINTVAIFDGNRFLTNGPLTVVNGTNITLTGQILADSATFTNNVLVGTLYQGTTKILTAGQHLTNIADIASSTAVAQVLSGTNAATIGQHTSDNSVATNGYNVPTIGKGITIKAGTNGRLSSTAETLSAGTVVVNNTSITANSKVFLQPTTVSPVSGVLAVTAKSVGTSFTVTSSNNQDTNQFSWFIVESQ